MPSRSMRRFASLTTSCLLTGLLACQAEEPKRAEPAAEAAAEAVEKKPAVDQKIANAMAAAQANAEPAEASAGQGAPPPDGILTAEAAAREVAPGAPASLVLGNEGATPRVKLGADKMTAGAGPSGMLELSYRSGGSIMPTVELELRAKVTPAEAIAAGDAGGALLTRFAVTKARPSAQQPGRLPENAAAEIAKIEGSAIELVSTSRGAVMGQRHQLAGKNPDLEPLVMGSAEVLGAALMPYPDVPVGIGGFWMVKSRETANGAEVLAYRMVRVAELSGDVAKLSVSTRRYIVGDSLPLAGFPPHRVRQFQSEGEGTLELRAGSAFPRAAELEDSFMALVTPNDRPNQALPVQSEIKAKLRFGQ